MTATGVAHEILEPGWVEESVPEKLWSHHNTTLHFLSFWHQFLFVKPDGFCCHFSPNHQQASLQVYLTFWENIYSWNIERDRNVIFKNEILLSFKSSVKTLNL